MRRLSLISRLSLLSVPLMGVQGLTACQNLVEGRSESSQEEPSRPCSSAWARKIEERVSTGDGRGHGPDPGSREWRSVVEFRLGIRGDPEVPSRESDAWCRFIDEIVRSERPSSSGRPESDRTPRREGDR